MLKITWRMEPSHIAIFAPAVLKDRLSSEVGGPGQGEAVFGDVGLVLGLIELDFHIAVCSYILASGQPFCRYKERR